MTTEELIKALREKPSRDNRKFLDDVADSVEMLQNAIFVKEFTEGKTDEHSLPYEMPRQSRRMPQFMRKVQSL